MYVYIGILIVLFLMALINFRLSASTKANISIAMIFLVMALKAPLFGDYSRYADHFIRAAFRTIKEMAAYKGEIGFHALTKAVTMITDNPSVYLAITSAIICILLGIYIHRFATSKIYAVYFYYTIGLFAFSLVGLRQVLAMSICLLAYEAIRKKNLLLFIIIIGVAFLFHKTAIIFLPAYFIARLQWKRWNIVLAIVSIGSFLLCYPKLYSFFAELLGYGDYAVVNSETGEIFTVILLVIGALGVIYKDQLLRMDSNNLIFLNLHFILIFLWLFRFNIGMVERPSFYYFYATIILLDKIFSLEFEDDSQSRTHKFILISALILFGLLFVYRLRRDINLVPYITIFRI
jgi:hypothetical protein